MDSSPPSQTETPRDKPPPEFGPEEKNPWLLRMPLVSLATAVGLVVLHALASTLSGDAQTNLWYEFASVPARFYAEPGSMYAYPNILMQAFSLVTPALLHGSWLHVLTNALMTWQFGTLVARALGPGIVPATQWMLLFVVSIAAGSLLFLAIAGPNGPVSIGASGGTSGLIGAGFLLDWENRVRSPFSRQFLTLTAVFAGINVVLVLAGPAVLGMAISWEAHAGGYIAGSAMMLIFGRKMARAPAA
jgi:membrane associated rhomboid family serine protease